MKNLDMDPCISISRITALKNMTINIIPNEVFKYQQIKLDGGVSEKLSDVDIVCLKGLGID